MKRAITPKSCKAAMYLSVFFILLLSTLQHSIYSVFSYSFISLWAPVNESVWEHCKIVYFPIIFIWIVYYFILKNKCNIDTAKWFFGGSIAAASGVFNLICLNYFSFSALNLPNKLFIHIPMLIAVIAISQLLGFHINKRVAKFKGIAIISIIINALMLTLFVAFTLTPPSVTLFLNQC